MENLSPTNVPSVRGLNVAIIEAELAEQGWPVQLEDRKAIAALVVLLGPISSWSTPEQIIANVGTNETDVGQVDGQMCLL